MGRTAFEMTGIIGFAPIYINGLLALFFVFVFPGMVLVRAFVIPNSPLRWFVVFLSSLTTNHLLVTMIAAFHLDPLETYRFAAVTLIAILTVVTVRGKIGFKAPIYPGTSTPCRSDVSSLLLSLTTLCLAYFNVWKHGVPNIFQGGDVSISWNAWALIWSHGLFPIGSGGYPQFVPTIWAVTYIFTGSTIQYFAFYTYVVMIIVPIVVTAMILARVSWWHAAVPVFAFVWFVAEIQESWLRSTLQNGFPDWVAAIFGFCGVVLFVTNDPKSGLDKEKIVTALVSLWLVSIASAIKPLYGLFTITILIRVCVDARHLQERDRNRLMAGAIGLVSVFVAAYAINYWHISERIVPNYPVSELSEKLARAVKLFNTNFTIPFKILVLTGILLGPFMTRIRWLTLPLLIGLWLWANNAGYDLRNILGLLLICAFIPLYAVMRAFVAPRAFLIEPRRIISDGAVALVLAALSVGLTLTLAQDDKALTNRFTNAQFAISPGTEFNRKIEQALVRGCTIFTADGYLATISAFEPFQNQIRFFFYGGQLADQLATQLNESTGCTGISYPPWLTYPSVSELIAAYAQSRGLKKVIEGDGMELLMSDPKSPNPG
jgi:hypothetical protein